MFSDNKHQPVLRKQFKVSGLPSLPLSPVPSQIFWENNYLLDDTLNFSGARWKTVLFFSLGPPFHYVALAHFITFSDPITQPTG